MGIVCSCFASVFMWTGELLESESIRFLWAGHVSDPNRIRADVFLAVGEIGSLLVRGIFGLLVGCCDLLAAVSCCCTVPYSERPDRTSYTVTSLNHNVGRGGFYQSYFTETGRVQRTQEKLAKKKEHDLRTEQAAQEKLEKQKAKDQAKLDAREKAATDKAAKKAKAEEDRKAKAVAAAVKADKK